MEEFEEMDPELFQQAAHEHAIFLGIDPEKEPQYLWIAEKALLAPLPENWKQGRDEHGTPYHFNTVTKESIWEHPKDEEFKQLFERLKREAIANGTYGKDNGGNPDLEDESHTQTHHDDIEEEQLNFDEIHEFDYNEESLEHHDLDTQNHDSPPPSPSVNSVGSPSNKSIESLQGADDDWMNKIVEEVENGNVQHSPSSQGSAVDDRFPEEDGAHPPQWNKQPFTDSVQHFDEEDSVEQFNTTHQHYDEPVFQNHQTKKTSTNSEHQSSGNFKKDYGGVQNQRNIHDENTILRLRKQLDARQVQYQNAEDEVLELKQKLKRLGDEKKTVEGAVDQLKSNVKELELQVEQREEYSSEMKRLQQQIKTLSTKEKEAEELEQHASEIREKLHQNNKRVVELSEQCASAESEVHKKQLEISKLKVELQDTKHSQDEVQQVLDQSKQEVSVLKGRNTELESELESTQLERDELLKELEAQKKVGPISPDERIQMEAQQNQLVKAESLAKAYQERLELVLREKEELLKQVQKQRMEFKERITSLESANRRMGSDLGVLSQEQSERVQSAELERAEAVRLLREAEAKVLKSESEQRREDLRAKRAETKLSEAMTMIDDLKGHIKTLTSDDSHHTESLQTENKRVNDQLIEAQRTARSLQEKLRTVQNKNALDIASLKENFSREITQAMEEAAKRAGSEWQRRGSSKIKSLSDQLAHVKETGDKEKRMLTAEIGSLRAQLERFGDGNEAMAKEMSAEIVKLTATNKTLVTLLDDARAQLSNSVNEAFSGAVSTSGRNRVPAGDPKMAQSKDSVSLRELQEQIEELRSKCFRVIHAEGVGTMARDFPEKHQTSGRGRLTAAEMADESKEHFPTNTLDAEELEQNLESSWNKSRINENPSVQEWMERSRNNEMEESARKLAGGLVSPSRSFLRSAIRLESSLNDMPISDLSASEATKRAKHESFNLDSLGPDEHSHAIAALTASYGGSHSDSAWYRRDYWKNRYSAK